MKLSDVVSGSGLSMYAEVALLIFFAVFVGVAAYVFFSRRTSFEHAARLPLDDDTTPPAAAASPSPRTPATRSLHRAPRAE